jgi:vacuolar protein sorting-associated protein 26
MAQDLISSNENIKIILDGAKDREHALFYDINQNLLKFPIFTQDDLSISGQIILNFGGKKLEHRGIFVQLIGETENYHNKDQPERFLFESKEIKLSGKLQGEETFNFSFSDFEKRYETYYGPSGRIRYYIKVVIVRESENPIRAGAEFAVQLPVLNTLNNQGFELQLKIADYLKVNVMMNKTDLHLNECLVGKIAVEQIKLMIKRIQISILKREITNPTPDMTITKEEILTKIEVADHCPKKGEIIPFRINLGTLDLSPTLQQSNPKLLIKYVMILSFIDEEDRSLFKPIEINMWRKK